MSLVSSFRGVVRTTVTVSMKVVRRAARWVRARPVQALSVGIGAAMAGASTWGLLDPALYGEPASVAALYRGLDVASLAAAAPALLWAVRRSGSGSARVELVWLGMLLYTGYTYLLYVFGVDATAARPLHLALVLAAVAGVAGLLRQLDPGDISRRLGAGRPLRLGAVGLGLLGGGLGAMWGFSLARHLISGEPLPEAQLVQTPEGALLSATADLALLVPSYLLAAVLLWRRSPWGEALGGALLAAGVVQQVGYQSGLLSQSMAGIPGASPFDPAEPVIVAVYAAGLAVVLGAVRRGGVRVHGVVGVTPRRR
ncbi:MAG TPA: hypothetical protein VFM09_07075 [Marmoricola sp.]|nr:hypothetical protein [Marmoricola sp.]